MTDDLSALLGRVRTASPGLAVRSARELTGGQNNRLLLVDETWLFRFPRYPPGARALAKEVAILRTLQGRVPLPIPDLAFANLEAASPGEAFVGYRMLPGAPLDPARLTALPPESRAGVAAALAAFLRVLHAVPAGAVAVDLPIVASPSRVAAMYARVRRSLFPRMRPAARRAVAAHFEEFLTDAHPLTPTLIHGDFGWSNILWNADAQRLSGVIDFGGAGRGDPAYDLAGVIASFGEPFLALLLEADPSLPPLVTSARFYAGTFALEEALFGLDSGDEEALRAGMAAFT